MFEKLKDILPGTFVSLLISLITTLVVFSGTFSSLRAEVQNNTEVLKNKVDQSEYKAILKGQEKMNDTFDKRFDRLEQKIDKINERGR